MPVPRVAIKMGLGEHHLMWLAFFRRYPEEAATVDDVLDALFPTPAHSEVPTRTALEVALEHLDFTALRGSHRFNMQLAAQDLVRQGILERKFVDGKVWWLLTDGFMPSQVAEVVDTATWKPDEAPWALPAN